MSSEQSTSQYGQDPHKGAQMTEPTTHTLDVPGATLTYDVHVPDTPSDKRPIFLFGSPMGATGFEQLVGHFTDRTVITYDPRGMERSTRLPDSEVTVEVHADDYDRVTEADGSRDDLLLSANLAMPAFEPDAEALRASSVRIVPAIGALGAGGLARRGGEAVARLLGVEPVIFPGDHGGFAANEWSPDNDPAAFAAKLREVLTEA